MAIPVYTKRARTEISKAVRGFQRDSKQGGGQRSAHERIQIVRGRLKTAMTAGMKATVTVEPDSITPQIEVEAKSIDDTLAFPIGEPVAIFEGDVDEVDGTHWWVISGGGGGPREAKLVGNLDGKADGSANGPCTLQAVGGGLPEVAGVTVHAPVLRDPALRFEGSSGSPQWITVGLDGDRYLLLNAEKCPVAF